MENKDTPSFSLRREVWDTFLTALDAALCGQWEGIARLFSKTEFRRQLRTFLTANDLTPTLLHLIRRDSATTLLPGEALIEMMGSAGAAELRNQRMARELERIGERAKAEDITLLTLKGLHLTQLLYGKLDARWLRDIDLLVAPTDRQSLDNILRDLGYRESNRLPFNLERRIVHATQWANDELSIDAHHTLRAQPGYHIDIGSMISDSSEQDVFGHTVRAPVVQDYLLILLLSLAGDLARGVVRCRSLIDIQIFLRLYDTDIDWPRFHHAARRQGVQHLVASTVNLVGASLPRSAGGYRDRLPKSGAHSDIMPRTLAVDLLSAKPLLGRRWYVRHSSAHPLSYLAWLVLGLPIRRWLSRHPHEVKSS